MSVSFSNQLTPTNQPYNLRILEDATLSKTAAMPVATAFSNTSHIDLAVATPYPTTETINVLVDIGAVAAGVNTGNNATVVLQHTSANAVAGDGTPNAVAWTNIPTLGTSTVVAAANAVAAQNFTYKLPPGCLQFIRAQIRPIASSTDTWNTGNITLKLLF